jgi:hypothetical protein
MPKPRLRSSQGSTLLWTEHYDVVHPYGAPQHLRDLAMASAWLVLAAGAAMFLTLQGPATRQDAIGALLRLLF